MPMSWLQSVKCSSSKDFVVCGGGMSQGLIDDEEDGEMDIIGAALTTRAMPLGWRLEPTAETYSNRSEC